MMMCMVQDKDDLIGVVFETSLPFLPSLFFLQVTFSPFLLLVLIYYRSKTNCIRII